VRTWQWTQNQITCTLSRVLSLCVSWTLLCVRNVVRVSWGSRHTRREFRVFSLCVRREPHCLPSALSFPFLSLSLFLCLTYNLFLTHQKMCRSVARCTQLFWQYHFWLHVWFESRCIYLCVLVFLRIPVDYVSLHACQHWRYIVMQLCMHVRYMYIHTHRQNSSMHVSVCVYACMHQCTTVIVWHDLPSFSES